MTCCRSHRMFFFSEKAKNNTQFAEYKQKLESAVNWFDTWSNTIVITPYATAVTYAVVSGVQYALGSEGSLGTIFTALHFTIAGISTCIIGGSEVGKKSTAKNVQELVSSGVKLGFFQITPNDISNNPSDDTSDDTPLNNHEQCQIHADALIHRLLGPAP